MRLRITKPKVETVGVAEVEPARSFFTESELSDSDHMFGDYTLAQSQVDFNRIIEEVSQKGWSLGAMCVKRGLKSWEYQLVQHWGIIAGHFRTIPIQEETYKPLRVMWVTHPSENKDSYYYTRENPADLILIQKGIDPEYLTELFQKATTK